MHHYLHIRWPHRMWKNYVHIYRCSLGTTSAMHISHMTEVFHHTVVSENTCPTEDLVHVFTRCRATPDARHRIMPELLNTACAWHSSNALHTSTPHDSLTQFILDCSSLNLPSSIRIPSDHPGFITRQCSNLTYGIHNKKTPFRKRYKTVRLKLVYSISVLFPYHN